MKKTLDLTHISRFCPFACIKKKKRKKKIPEIRNRLLGGEKKDCRIQRGNATFILNAACLHLPP